LAKIIGEPYYQIFKNFDHWLAFNTTSSSEERQIKLLLSMPLVPQHIHQNVKLQTVDRHKRKMAEDQMLK
jgi:hypothetical protein